MSRIFYLPEEWTSFMPAETPRSVPWKSQLTMKTGKAGCVYIWQIGFDGKLLHTAYGSANSHTVVTKEVPVGLQGRTIEEQAIQMAKTDYKNKYKDGYIMSGSSQPPKKKGMKGHPFKEGCMRGKPFMASPKLNGIRLLSTNIGGKMVSRSYLNRKFNHLKAIEEQLLIISMYMGSYVMFDGELYNHKMAFNDICSAVKTVNATHNNLKYINFHIFEYYTEDNPPCEERMENLRKAFRAAKEDGHTLPNLRLVKQKIVKTEDSAVKLMHKCIKQGYEGLVIKKIANGSLPGSRDYESSRYIFGRSTSIYKMKTFIDEEGVVIRVEDCNGKEEGLAKLIIKSDKGIEVAIRHGKNEERRKWLENPSLVVGKLFTFKYFEMLSDEAYIQPTGVGFRDYE